MISTQPGSTPVASFKILALEEVDPYINYTVGNDFGKIKITSIILSNRGLVFVFKFGQIKNNFIIPLLITLYNVVFNSSIHLNVIS